MKFQIIIFNCIFNSSEPQNISGASGNNTSLNSPPVKAQRPKPVNQWTVADVQKWLSRHCREYYSLYSIKFLEQDITGRFIFSIFDPGISFCKYCKIDNSPVILQKLHQHYKYVAFFESA